jgi:hypothetical protein
MDSSKLVLKIYADPSATSVKPVDTVPVFHSWIQKQLVKDHLLIDVADYSHVPDGPGTVLVSHEANFYLDELDGRLGLSYSRKQALPGTLADRLHFVRGALLDAAKLLAADATIAGRIEFRPGEFTFKINDRLLGPNTPATFEAVRPDLQRVFEGAKLEPRFDGKRLFEVGISAPVHAAVA